MALRTETSAADSLDPNEESIRGNIQDMKVFAASLTMEDLKTGNWFALLLGHALQQYRTKVDGAYFDAKYPGMPRDAVVDARISLAARYAALEGGISASAYTGAVAATIGTAGGASPITASAAVLSFSIDLFATTALQLRLAYDISVLYRINIDLNDPEDLWKFLRIAFAIKAAEAAEGAVAKSVPMFVRPLIKRIFSGSTLASVRSLPVVGKHLLQRNLIKFTIPAVTIPLSTAVNYWTARAAGNFAKNAYRAEADLRQRTQHLAEKAPAHRACLWIAWLVFTVDGPVNETETAMMRHLIASMESVHGVIDTELTEVVTVNAAEVWELVEGLGAERAGLHRLGVAAAEVDGEINKLERSVLDQLATYCM